MIIDPSDFSSWYDKRESVWEEALRRLKEDVSELMSDAGEYREYRPKITGRVKSNIRLQKKMQAQHVSVQEAEERIYDIVGVRVICHNLEDIDRAVFSIRARGREHGLEVEELDDKIKTPAISGYRSVHLRCRYDPDASARQWAESLRVLAPERGNRDTGFILHGKFVPTGQRTHEYLPEIRCEIQVRTAIQDAWAMLSHADLYEEYEKMPPQLTSTYAHLSEIMSGVDKIVQEIRQQAVGIKYPDIIIAAYAEPLDFEGLLRVYKKVFGSKAAVDVIKEALDTLADRGMAELSPVEEALLTRSTREIIDSEFDYLLNEAPDEDDYFLGTMCLVRAEDSRYLQDWIGRKFGISLSDYECTECGHRMTSEDEQRYVDEVGSIDPYCSTCIDEVLTSCMACGAVKTANEGGICDNCEDRWRRE